LEISSKDVDFSFGVLIYRFLKCFSSILVFSASLFLNRLACHSVYLRFPVAQGQKTGPRVFGLRLYIDLAVLSETTGLMVGGSRGSVAIVFRYFLLQTAWPGQIPTFLAILYCQIC